MKWTSEMDDTLKRMRNERQSFAACGRELKLTRNACIGRAQRIGIPAITGETFSVEERKLRQQTRERAKSERLRKTPRRVRPIGEQGRLPFAEVPADCWQPIPGVPPVTLMDLEVDACRWPLECEGGSFFCGAARNDSTSYCPAHAALSRGSHPTSSQKDLLRLMFIAGRKVAA